MATWLMESQKTSVRFKHQARKSAILEYCSQCPLLPWIAGVNWGLVNRARANSFFFFAWQGHVALSITKNGRDTNWMEKMKMACLQSRSQSFVPLDQRSENESSGSIHFQITMEITEFCISGFTAHARAERSLHIWYLWCMPEMDASRALVFRPLVKGNEALGTRLACLK